MNLYIGMTEEMYADEYTSIANIDISSTVIEQQKERNKERQTLSWATMDVTKKLEFPDGTFHVVIDKGTLDCILCGESSTNNVTNALFEIVRVLKPDGKFVLISHGIPDKWLGYLEQGQFKWKVSSYAIPRPSLVHLLSHQGASASGSMQPPLPPGPIVIAGVDGPYYPSNVHFMYVCEKKASSDLGVLKE